MFTLWCMHSLSNKKKIILQIPLQRVNLLSYFLINSDFTAEFWWKTIFDIECSIYWIFITAKITKHSYNFRQPKFGNFAQLAFWKDPSFFYLLQHMFVLWYFILGYLLLNLFLRLSLPNIYYVKFRSKYYSYL